MGDRFHVPHRLSLLERRSTAKAAFQRKCRECQNEKEFVSCLAASRKPPVETGALGLWQLPSP
ncbi:MAG: hypothetical protein JWP63_3881 [Candidatus Solibacter sp.]|nr:hypothetical protein [Candidatus Solibacter sp.]